MQTVHAYVCDPSEMGLLAEAVASAFGAPEAVGELLVVEVTDPQGAKLTLAGPVASRERLDPLLHIGGVLKEATIELWLPYCRMGWHSESETSAITAPSRRPLQLRRAAGPAYRAREVCVDLELIARRVENIGDDHVGAIMHGSCDIQSQVRRLAGIAVEMELIALDALRRRAAEPISEDPEAAACASDDLGDPTTEAS